MANRVPAFGLASHGIDTDAQLHWNFGAAALVEEAVRRREGILARHGPLVVETGRHTGRSAKDKFIVRDWETEESIWWDNNPSMTPEHFQALKRDFLAALGERNELFVADLYGGSQPEHRVRVRVINELAWHNLFIRTLLVRPEPHELEGFEPDFTIIDLPTFVADPARHGCRSETVIAVSMTDRMILIGGTAYAGEMKKSVFGVLNYLLPPKGVMPMHCSANHAPGDPDDVAIFFGLSGTGKTTLSADPSRTLIGDDEHGWSERGVFNYEGGCYAKVIRLSPEAEPDIYAASHRFGTVLENVGFDTATGELGFDDDSLTENTRSAYPIDYIRNATLEGMGGHPRNVILLTADAFGVLPPVARLSRDQAIYHFLSGYTSKLAGTERGVTEPAATFSTCFGAPFVPLPPTLYGTLLGEKLDRHGTEAWFVNTGWSGGPYGVGQRMRIAHTRAMVHAILDGSLREVPFQTEPNFGLAIPTACPNVPNEILNPRDTWADKEAYDTQARKLAAMFADNFREFADHVAPAVRAAGPRAG